MLHFLRPVLRRTAKGHLHPPTRADIEGPPSRSNACASHAEHTGCMDAEGTRQRPLCVFCRAAWNALTTILPFEPRFEKCVYTGLKLTRALIAQGWDIRCSHKAKGSCDDWSAGVRSSAASQTADHGRSCALQQAGRTASRVRRTGCASQCVIRPGGHGLRAWPAHPDTSEVASCRPGGEGMSARLPRRCRRRLESWGGMHRPRAVGVGIGAVPAGVHSVRFDRINQ